MSVLSLRAFHYKIESRYILNECIYIRVWRAVRGKKSFLMNNLFRRRRTNRKHKVHYDRKCFIIIDVFISDIDFGARTDFRCNPKSFQSHRLRVAKQPAELKFIIQTHFQFVWLNLINRNRFPNDTQHLGFHGSASADFHRFSICNVHIKDVFWICLCCNTCFLSIIVAKVAAGKKWFRIHRSSLFFNVSWGGFQMRQKTIRFFRENENFWVSGKLS